MANRDWKLSPLEWRDISKFAHTLFRFIETLQKPVIGVVKTGAVGVGLENLHACDFVIASENAKFSQPEVNLRLIAGWGGTQRLTRLVGWRKAKQLLLTGVEIDGKEAEAIGLINKTVPIELVDEEVEKLSDGLKRCAPVAWGYAKLSMNKVWETDHKSGLDFEVESLAMVASQNEFNQSVFDDFINGKQPVFVKRKNVTYDWG